MLCQMTGLRTDSTCSHSTFLAVVPSDKGKLVLYIGYLSTPYLLSTVPSDNNDLVLADVVQQFIPRWWPFNIYFSLYVHAVLTLEQSTSGGGLQCCWQTCLSSMLRNAGVILIWVLISTTPGANFTQGLHHTTCPCPSRNAVRLHLLSSTML